MQLFSSGLRGGSIVQVAHIVEDLQASMQRWTRQSGVGPFFVIEHFPLKNVLHRGEPCDLDIHVALTFSGSTCFELIQQNDQTPSVYREVIARRGYGLHHVAIATDTFDAEVAKRSAAGDSIIASALVGVGARVAYVDTFSELGCLLEIIELAPPVEQLFGFIQTSCAGWDGKDPVRQLPPPSGA